MPAFRLAPCALMTVLATALTAAHADDIHTVQNLTQGEFRDLSEDLTAVLSFKPMIPSESMGVTGFDVGVAVTGTELQHRGVWAKASGGKEPSSTLPSASVRVHKGLPGNVDLGASWTQTDTNASAFGGEARWAVLPGSTLVPAVALRGSVSVLSGVSQIDMQTYGLDVSVSKGFAMFTPYAGVGSVWTTAKPDGSTGLAKESFNLPKVYAGLNVNLGLINVAAEADRTGDATSYGLKLGVRF